MRRRLLTLLLASVVLAWAVTTFLAYQHGHHELDELLDAHLARSARLLLAQEGDELEEIRLGPAEDAGPYGQEVVLQVWRDGRQLVLRSAGAPVERLSRVESGFSDSAVAGRNWRVFSGWDVEGQVLIQVAEDHALRERLLSHYTLSGLPAVLFGVPLLGVLVWLIVGAAVRPLAHLGHQVSRRGPADLHPLAEGGAPTEIQPLVERLNALFARIGDSMQAERRFTSHAAHELRTPIAAIRAQAQVALGETEDALRRRALNATLDGCDRAVHLVEQLLTLSRLEAGADSAQQRVDLRAVARDVVAALAGGAIDKRQELELDADEPCIVRGNEALLGVLIRNLVDNAIRYSPPGARVKVALRPQPEQVVLTVEDSGPGLADEDRARLGQRFFRVLGSEQSGSGLGWSIVERIAAAQRAELRVGRSVTLAGLAVEVRWPRFPDRA